MNSIQEYFEYLEGDFTEYMDQISEIYSHYIDILNEMKKTISEVKFTNSIYHTPYALRFAKSNRKGKIHLSGPYWYKMKKKKLIYIGSVLPQSYISRGVPNVEARNRLKRYSRKNKLLIKKRNKLTQILKQLHNTIKKGKKLAKSLI